MARKTEEVLTEGYPIVVARMLDAYIDLLAEARREHGDLDRLMILLSLAQRAYSDPAVAEALLGEGGPVLPEGVQARATNTLSLAQALGLPKETVRRKVKELIDCGLAERRKDGVAITPAAVNHLAGPRGWFIRMAAIHHDRIDQLRGVAAASEDPPDDPQMPAYHS